MLKVFWKSILVSPAIALAALVLSPSANAQETFQAESQQNFDKSFQLAQAQNNEPTIDQLENYSNEGQTPSQSQDQVTSVNELKDVQPTEWAYEALRSLVERYGCIVGYPDLTYRGNRALTRWEFAAGLNACMNTMERLIQENVAVLKEDVDTIKRLSQEFEAELAALGARVDNLEGRVAFLEDHQFSTTTKLQGEAIFAITDSFGDDDQTQTIFADRVRLAFNTSFTGEDRLVTRIAAGNANPVSNSTFDINGETDIASPTSTQQFNIGNTGNDVFLDWLAYYYPIKLGEETTINTYVAANAGIWSDVAPTSNPFFEDYDGGNGALSTFSSSNPIFRIGGGSGAILNADLGFLQVSGGYLAGGAPNSPQEGSGLFNGDYSALAQVNFSPIDSLELGLTYVHAFHKAGSPIFGYGVNGPTAALVGTSTVNYAGSGGDRVTNTYGAQASWRIVEPVSFSAFFSYGDLKQIGGFDSEYWTYGGGFSFPDLGKEGSVLGVFAGVQPYLGDEGLLDGNNNELPFQVEAFYKYQLTDNISVTPGVVWISNPEQQNDSDDEFIGTLRTTFTF
jgi:hypothetical protein